MKLTPKDFEYHKKEVLKWVKILSLGDWDITFRKKDLTEEGYIGQCTTDYRARKVTFTLTTRFKDRELDFGLTLRQIIHRNARHEVLELLLARLHWLAEDRSWDTAEWEAETHAVINRLLKVLL